MIARIQKSIEKRDAGFTLIELLVVMIIIGILAAVAIPIFLNQRKKAEDSAAKADVSTLGKEIASYYVDGTGVPTVALTGGRWIVNGVDVGKASTNVVLKAAPAAAATSTTWCVSVLNDQGDKATTANGGVSYSAQGGMKVDAEDC